MTIQKSSTVARRNRKRRSGLRFLAPWLWTCLVLMSSPALGQETLDTARSSSATPATSRHHVIFLIDTSGSVLGYPEVEEQRLARLRRALTEDLPGILDDGRVNGFGAAIFDPARDLSSAFAFGLSESQPFFGPGHGADGFLRQLWFEERDRSYPDLLGFARRSHLWTAHSAAFGLAVWQVQWERERRGLEPIAFERTFLVMVTDGKANPAAHSLDELRNIHGAAAALGAVVEDLRSNRRKAGLRFQLLNSYYSLRSPENDENLGGFPLGPRGALKVLIRELVPHRLDGIDSLLRLRPDRRTVLERRPGGEYAATLRLAMRTDSATDWSYQLLRAEYQALGASAFEEVPVPSPATPLELEVRVARQELDGAKARFRLSFLRDDPAYGQAIQTFEDVVHFVPEPNRRVLGLFEVRDWMMAALPFLSQQQIANVTAYLLFFLILAALYLLLFPLPRAAAEWLAAQPAAGGEKPTIPVDFDRARASRDSGYAIVLGTLRFSNAALRLGRLPRAEKRFDVRVQVRLEAPETVVTGDRPVLGLSAAMESRADLKGLSQGSEVTVGLCPSAIPDFTGDWRQPVACRAVVEAEQIRRSPRRRPRPLKSFKEQFQLRFLPEAPGLLASLEPTPESPHRAETRALKLPDGSEVTRWLVVPHMRAFEQPPELVLRLRSTAERVCAAPCTARLAIFLSRADGSEPLRVAAQPRLPAAEENREVALERVQPAEGSPYWRIPDIRAGAGAEWAIEIPIALDYDQIPSPASVSDDYLLEIELSPAGGQLWPTVRQRYGVRIDSDPRRAQLVLAAATDIAAATEAGGSDELLWNSFAGPGDRDELVIEVPDPVPWTVGAIQAVAVLARLRIDNLAHAGSGEVTLTLLPGVEVGPGPEADEGFEPDYRTSREEMLELAWNGRQVPFAELDEAIEWTIGNEAERRPIELDLRFNPGAIRHFNRNLRTYPFCCRLPWHCRVRPDAQAEAAETEFHLVLRFTVERYTGDNVLAIDFGTSAVVAAFEQSILNVQDRDRGFAAATLDLQERYVEVLLQRDALEGAALHQEAETAVPNVESGSRFIPSHLVWRPDAPLGTADFVHLPATTRQVLDEPGRAIYYLKALILRGETQVPSHRQFFAEAVRGWCDRDGSRRVDAPPVDGLIESAYRHLVEGYVEPLLLASGREDQLDQIVVACPNNFTLGHLERLRRVLEGAFPGRFQFDFLSESKAVAIYCCTPPERFLLPEQASQDTHHLLVYDVGAGTLDLTYTRLDWDCEDEGYALKEMEVLFQSGIAVAGNRLDVALAKVLDAKIRHLQRQLADRGVELDYRHRIVQPEASSDDGLAYPQRMLPIQRALHRLKVEASNLGRNGACGFTLHVPVAASPDLVDGILQLTSSVQDEEVQAVLRELDVQPVDWSDRARRKLAIPLRGEEIFHHPEVRAWTAQVTDEVLADVAGALKQMDLKPKIDAVILSGRSSLFPPLRPRLLAAMEKHLGIPAQELHVVDLGSIERKEAVALGCLHYSLLLRGGVRFRDRIAWARYGVIYETGRGTRFKEFFGFATHEDPERGDEVVEQDGLRTVLFRRTETISCVGARADVAVTFSRDPERDVRDPRKRADKFTIVHSLGGEILQRRQGRKSRRLEIEMRIDRRGRLGIRINPRHLPQEITNLLVRPMVAEPEQDWPFQPLTDPVELAPFAPPGFDFEESSTPETAASARIELPVPLAEIAEPAPGDAVLVHAVEEG